MEPKVTVYLSIIITSFFASCMIPFTVFLSQPLSLIILVYFRPALNKKIVCGALIGLFLANVLFDTAWYLSIVNTFVNTLTVIGVPDMLAITFTVLTIFATSTYLSFISADKIITKINLRKRTLQFYRLPQGFGFHLG
jgi:hypothetical protein